MAHNLAALEHVLPVYMGHSGVSPGIGSTSGF